MNDAPADSATDQRPTTRPSWRPDALNGAALWLVTNIAVLGTGCFGWHFVTPLNARAETLLSSFANWDGGWYAGIADHGYSFRPGQQSSPAFFPAYPLLGRAVSAAFGLPSKTSLFIVAQAFLLASFVLFHRYVRVRYPREGTGFAALALTVLAVFPATFFYRMAYTESLFIFIVLAFLYTVECRSSLVVLALLAGLATATRGAGLGLVPALVAEAWFRSRTWGAFVGRCAYLVPLSTWGLVAYIAYLNSAVGEPLAFMKAQEGWNIHPGAPLTEKLYALATFKPVWGSVLPDSGFFFPADRGGRFSTSAINAFVFVLTCTLVLIGLWKRWLNAAEFLTSAGMLGVTYMSKAFDSNMLSFARYASATPPMYVVLALLLRRAPSLWTYAYIIICVGIMVIVTMLFTAGYHVI